jgi:hypothetical protein
MQAETVLIVFTTGFLFGIAVTILFYLIHKTFRNE